MFRELLAQKLGGIATLSSAQLSILEGHFTLLQRWNQSLNLTRIDTLEDAVERHYCESLFLAAHLPAGEVTIADVGSGAGFPGFPVAVFRPDCAVTLIESHQRKAVFLKEAARGLSNVRVLAKRAEEVKERFGRVISRAVSYDDLVRPLKKLTDFADLLTGVEEPPKKLGFSWDEPIALPWGSQRQLRSGRVEGPEWH